MSFAAHVAGQPCRHLRDGPDTPPTGRTLGYREPDGSGMSVLDALYFTIQTIGTVGFGDFYFRDQQAWLRGWAIFLMVFDATRPDTWSAVGLDDARAVAVMTSDDLAGTVSGSFDFPNVRSPSALAAPAAPAVRIHADSWVRRTSP